MAPFFPRKPLSSSSPDPEPGPSNQQNLKGKKSKPLKVTPRKATLFDDLDAGAKSPGDTKSILQKIQATDDNDDDDESSLSSLSDDEFEDVPNINRRQKDDATDDEDEDEDDDEDEDIEFEDVDTNIADKPSANIPTGDLELTLTKETRISLTNPLGTKKGPSKIERGIRIATHQVHVQMLMWHNAIRNSWLCDKELQSILVGQLPETILREVERWRKDSGLQTKAEDTPWSKGKGKEKPTKGKKVEARSQRDWGKPAERQEKFRIVAPGLRKVGYMSLDRLDQESKSFQKDEHDVERHGERIVNIHEFRRCAKTLEGSRDVGAQLFTALLRGIGIESRMIASLQPVGFGWNKNEDAAEKKEKKRKEVTPEDDTSDAESSEEEKPVQKPTPKSVKKGDGKVKAAQATKKPARSSNKPARRSARGNGLKEAPIDLSESEELSVADSQEEDDDSVVDITPAKTRVQPSKPYDKDLLFPHYWTELSQLIPNFFKKFETRGAKADKAKQVTAYIVGHSSDGTAKDVTIRYLKGHMLPGRTKGNRIPVEKVPIYNSRGKIKRYEYFDWFKTVMSGYVRGVRKCPRTEIDDHEEATDLKAIQPKKKEVKEGEETLQSYKSSTEFVLERHLRREEAILDTAKHVKMFTVKAKGDNPTEEKVYLRRDVVSCKSLETWHKEGRAPLPGAIPRKRVPYRAATTNRKRELAEAEMETGEKMLQGLYSRDQTDWIIPPPIENGVIPKNNYGNMDVYVQRIDYAEAVTGFEFGARMAIPIITGVVVAAENFELVMEQWEKDEAERVRKEDEKKTKAAITMWRKMLMGLRIIERMTGEYGDGGTEVDLVNPFNNKNGKGKKVDEDSISEERAIEMQQQDEEMAGGFFPDGHDEEEPEAHHSTSFFPVVASQEDEDGDHGGGGFIVEDEEEEAAGGVNGRKSTSQTFQFIGNETTANNSTSSADTNEETDEEIQTKKPQVIIPAPNSRARGRPAGSTSKKVTQAKPTPSKAKPRTLAKRAAPAPAPKPSNKRKRIPDSEDEDDMDESSSLSDIEMNDEEESDVEVVPPPKKPTIKKPAAKRRATMPAPTAPTRKTPRRNAKRVSETALRSHYFDHGGDSEDEDEAEDEDDD
ncbi:hypothetical protein EYC84_000529 [Monilinia fructicola]|uniref:Rad4 beta-hairpin domain-containing protein n=1 Tax=Monilinia fructicola TaxID=38448 RepID=A0A5M9JS05_MONFR|nr:hypothetical protein EYC84_000529 [Monilinia fructicola]